MELRGIEPLSENLSIAASPITVISLTFPPSDAKWQAADFSSFISSFYPAKLWKKSASPIWRRWLEWWAARGRRAAVKLLTRNYRLRLILSSGLLRGPGPRMASPTSKSPSKPVQPRVVINWSMLVRKRIYIIFDFCFFVKLFCNRKTDIRNPIFQYSNVSSSQDASLHFSSSRSFSS